MSPQEKGHLFEQWIILQVIAYIHIHRKDWRLSAYRTDAGAEVDLVIDAGNRFLAIECKWGKNVVESQLRGLQSFEEVARKPVEKYAVFRGERREKFSRNVVALPFETFLGEILPEVS